jgi:hypothetical protein
LTGLTGGRIYPDHSVDMSQPQNSLHHTFSAGKSQSSAGVLQGAKAPDDASHRGAIHVMDPGKVEDDARLILSNKQIDFLVDSLAVSAARNPISHLQHHDARPNLFLFEIHRITVLQDFPARKRGTCSLRFLSLVGKLPDQSRAAAQGFCNRIAPAARKNRRGRLIHLLVCLSKETQVLTRGRSGEFLYRNPEVHITFCLSLPQRKEVEFGQFLGTVNLSKFPFGHLEPPRTSLASTW